MDGRAFAGKVNHEEHPPVLVESGCLWILALFLDTLVREPREETNAQEVTVYHAHTTITTHLLVAAVVGTYIKCGYGTYALDE